MSRRTWHIWLRLSYAVLSLPGLPVCGEEAAPILFGVFPYPPPTRLEQVYAPLAADLSEAVGREVQLRSHTLANLTGGQVSISPRANQ